MVEDARNGNVSAILERVVEEYSTFSKEPGFDGFAREFLLGLKSDELSSIPMFQLARGICAQWITRKALTDQTPFAVQVYQESEISGQSAPEGPVSMPSPPSISVLTPDSSYLVDTFVEAVRHRGFEPALTLHPLIPSSVVVEEAPTSQYSCLYIELDSSLSKEQRQELEEKIRDSYLDLLCYQADRLKMDAELKDELAEVSSLSTSANVLDDYGLGSFRVTGTYSLDATGEVKELQGSAIRHREQAIRLASPDRYAFIESSTKHVSLCVLTAHSSILRSAPIRAISISDNGGSEKVYFGVFVEEIQGKSAWEAPGLRPKLERVLQHSGFATNSYSYRSLRTLLAGFGPDELVSSSPEKLWELCITALAVDDVPRLRVHQTPGAREDIAHVWVFLPAERYEIDLEDKFAGEITAAFLAKGIHLKSSKLQSRRYQVGFVVAGGANSISDEELFALEDRLEQLSLPWSEKLRQLIVKEAGREGGLLLLEKYKGSFPPDYQDEFTPKRAYHDILRLEGLHQKSSSIDIEVFRSDDDPMESEFNLRMFKIGKWANLSEIVPKLENFGFVVIDEVPFEIQLPGTVCWLVTIGVSCKHGIAEGQMTDPKDVDRLRKALINVFEGVAADDALNTLVLRTNLDTEQVALIRTYVHYVRFSTPAVGVRNNWWAMVECPGAASALFDLFDTRFNPKLSKSERNKKLITVQGDLDNELLKIESLDFDRAVRRISAAIMATLRTNYFQNHRGGIAIKLDPPMVGDLPKPLPQFETFYDSIDTEAIHLRAGRIARGGIRFSDRPDDYRTEILGLMKAQSVKNSVIVPIGAKGGFIVKHAPRDRVELLARAKASYSEFMEGLLSITDNLVDDKVIKPQNCICYDDDDYYLVVAADKGTATFSDIANEISLKKGFWLGDAFASGGSRGYDHKAMGITARGAWKSVEHHFEGLGINPNTDRITVVGVGDMSGDVFGNGLLMSSSVALVAAFDHRHIFLDPNPDPTASYEERKRLFSLETSSWASYDSSVISKGGGVFNRNVKSIDLSMEMAGVLGIASGPIEPNKLMSAILSSPVDLLWNGGVGTFVKSHTEDDVDVSDKANDAIRINASKLRVKVVGEGGNLGMTQKSRIEYSMLGGRCNTDAIDNSAGVDTSDHEVNLKVLLAPMLRTSEIDLDARDALLFDSEPEIKDFVLKDNVDQNWTLSVAEQDAKLRPELYRNVITYLEDRAGLDRTVEFLPSDDELSARNNQGSFLTRPELAVLLAYSKIHLYHHLLDSDLIETAYANELFEAYFPAEFRDRFHDRLLGHSLKKEITATVISNLVINISGVAAIVEILRSSPYDLSTVATGLVSSLRVLDASRRVEEIFSDGSMDQSAKVELLALMSSASEGLTRWLASQHSLLEEASHIQQLADLANGLSQVLDAVLEGTSGEHYRDNRAELKTKGVNDTMANFFAAIPYMSAVVPLDMLIEKAPGLSLKSMIWTFFRVGEIVGTPELFRILNRVQPKDRWEQALRASVISDLYLAQVSKTQQVLDLAPIAVGDNEEMKLVAKEIATRLEVSTNKIGYLVELLRNDPDVGIVAVSIVAREISLAD